MKRVADAIDMALHAIEVVRSVLAPRRRTPVMCERADLLHSFAGNPRQWVQDVDRCEYAGDEHLGWGWLARWAASRTPWSVAAGTAATHIAGYAADPPDAPRRVPHTIVEAHDLIIDFSRLYRARTLKHRPRYRMGRGFPYHRYRAGALQGNCSWHPLFRLDQLPRDHLRDIFDSFRAVGARGDICDDTIEHPVLFVSREGDESANLFHATTDFLNAFQAVLVTAGVDRGDLGIVLLDNAPPGPFDRIWTDVFAVGRGVWRVRDFGGRRVRFRRAIFSPPGYQSCLYAYLHGDNAQPARVGMLDAFAALVLRAHGVDPVKRAIGTGGPARATMVLRRPRAGRTASKRQLADEAACVRAVAAIDGVSLRTVDFARLAVADQIRVAADSDVLIGAHGAALTHLLWTPPHARIIEVDRVDRGWNTYRNLSVWTDRAYTRVAAEERATARGTELVIDPAQLAAAVRAAL